MLNKYEFLAPLGSGGFCTVYKARHTETHDLVAVKVEQVKAEVPSIVEREGKTLEKLQGVKGVPKVIEYSCSAGYGLLVMELLGDSILSRDAQTPLTVSRACSIICHVLKIVQRVHERKLLHRDIKPQNILFGVGRKRHKLYLIDFNLAVAFDPAASQQKQHRHSSFIGTMLFSSASAFARNPQSRRDDLESLCNVLVWLITLRLPWFMRVGSIPHLIPCKKATATPEEIASGCPLEVAEMVRYVRALKFTDCPDYAYLRRLLKTARKQRSGSADPAWIKSLSQPEDDKTHRKRAKYVQFLVPRSNTLEETPKIGPPTMSDSLRLRIRALHKTLQPLGHVGKVATEHPFVSVLAGCLVATAGSSGEQKYKCAAFTTVEREVMEMLTRLRSWEEQWDAAVEKLLETLRKRKVEVAQRVLEVSSNLEGQIAQVLNGLGNNRYEVLESLYDVKVAIDFSEMQHAALAESLCTLDVKPSPRVQQTLNSLHALYLPESREQPQTTTKKAVKQTSEIGGKARGLDKAVPTHTKKNRLQASEGNGDELVLDFRPKV